MVIGPDYVFVSCPKNATHTVYQVLCEHFGGERIDPWHNRAIPKYAKPRFTFAAVRNPYDRAVSIWASTKGWRYRYQDKVGSEDFAPFCRWMARLRGRPPDKQGINLPRLRPLLLSQSEWLEPVRLDAVIHVEALDAELAALPFWHGEIPLPRLNVHKHKPWREYMTPEAAEWILAWAARDFALYGYDPEDW